MAEHRNVPDELKKELLRIVLNKITVDYDDVEKVHRLTINFKIPVYIQGMDGAENAAVNVAIKAPKKGRRSLDGRGDQTSSVEDYSTVTGRLSIGGINHHQSYVQNSDPPKGYSLRLLVVLRLSNLWSPPYSPYQQELFDIITKFHEQDGWNFKQVSDWLTVNGYKTPRGRVFKENIVWSIYIKKNRSITRFSRVYDPIITDMSMSVTDYIPVS